MNCPKNKKHDIIMVEDQMIYDGISYIYCYDCEKLYDRWDKKDVSKKHKNLIEQFKK